MKRIYNQLIIKETDNNIKKITRKIGNKIDLIVFLSEYFNVNKELLNFEFEDDFNNDCLIKDINEIKNKHNNINIEYFRDFTNDNITIQLNDMYRLHIKHMYHGYTTNYFSIWKESLNDQDDLSSLLIIEWIYE